MENNLPEKAKLLHKLKANGFNVPDFLYVSAQTFKTEDFKALKAFLCTAKATK